MRIRCLLGLLLTISSVGCVAFRDAEYCVAQRMKAHRAWYTDCDHYWFDNPFSHHAMGWRKGYYEVLMGGDGQCPPLPPECYWSHKFQSDRGEAAIECWFQGYEQGAATALANCQDHYSHVPFSNTFRNAGPSCLPGDQSPYALGKTSLGIVPSQGTSTRKSAVPEKPGPVRELAPAPSSESSSDNAELPPTPVSRKSSRDEVPVTANDSPAAERYWLSFRNDSRKVSSPLNGSR